MCLRHYVKLIWESPATEDKNLSIIYAPFIQNPNQMASRLTITTSFPEGIFSAPVIFRATFKLFGSQGCSDDKREVKHDVYGRRQTAKIISDFLLFSCNP